MAQIARNALSAAQRHHEVMLAVENPKARSRGFARQEGLFAIFETRGESVGIETLDFERLGRAAADAPRTTDAFSLKQCQLVANDAKRPFRAQIDADSAVVVVILVAKTPRPRVAEEIAFLNEIDISHSLRLH